MVDRVCQGWGAVAQHGAKQNQFEQTSLQGAVQYLREQGLMHRTKIPASPGQLVLYKEAVCVWKRT